MAKNDVLSDLLKQNAGLRYDSDKNKVVCTYNDHEMPYRIEALQSFISGKKYQKLRDKHTCQLLVEYKEHIVPSLKKQTKHQLFCKLTLRHLNNLPHHIERHVNGKRFKKALGKWRECKEKGVAFIPRGGQARKKEDSVTDSVKSSNSMLGKMQINTPDDAVEQDFEDDLDDLYPPEDFHSGEETDEESDFDMENVQAESDPNRDSNNVTTGEKRKADKELSEAVVMKKAKKSFQEKKKKHKKPKAKTNI